MGTLSRWVGGLARALAILAGVLLVALVLLVTASVTGRGLATLAHSDLVEARLPGFGGWLLGLGVGPIDGDFEVLEAGIAVAIFAMLPLCQYVGGHARVDVFTRALPEVVQRVLGAFWEIVLAAVIVLIGVQLYAGLRSKLSNGETTFLLQFPVWWAYAACFAACAVAMLVAVFCAAARTLALFTGRDVLPSADEALH